MQNTYISQRKIQMCGVKEKGERNTEVEGRKRIPEIQEIIFKNKQNIPWDDVEKYLKKYIGSAYIVETYKDKIFIAGDFPDEYAESKYTKSLRGALAKVKANAAQIIGELISNAENRRWIENKNSKHFKDASQGWYRYDTYFVVPVKGSNEDVERKNVYGATLVVRKTEQGMFLYDMINIKKEASMPLEPK